MKFAYAPRQHLVDLDGEVDRLFREALLKLKDAGDELVEIDLGGDFLALTARTTCLIFLHETLPAVREFLVANEVSLSFCTALNANRHERLAVCFHCVRTRRCAALPDHPVCSAQIEKQWIFQVGGKDVTDIFLSRNTHPASSAGVPGISLPMGLNSEGLPLCLELDMGPGRDRDLLALARRIERVIGRVPGLNGF